MRELKTIEMLFLLGESHTTSTNVEMEVNKEDEVSVNLKSNMVMGILLGEKQLFAIFAVSMTHPS